MDNQFEFMMYRAAEEDVSVNALIRDETIWLTQKAMGELFGVDKSTISRHLKNIFQEGELDEKVVVAEIATTTQHGAIAEQIPLCHCGTDGGRDCLHEGRQRKRTYGADNMEKCA